MPERDRQRVPEKIQIHIPWEVDYIKCNDCKMEFILLAIVGDHIFEQGTCDYCPYCGKKINWPNLQEEHNNGLGGNDSDRA